MNPRVISITVHFTTALLVLLFVYTATMKLRDIPLFIGAMTHVAWLRKGAPLLAVAVPVTELVASILLMIARTRSIGLWMSSALMAIFTGYVGFILITATELPCTCGGVIQRMKWPQHLVFNIIFLIIAITGLIAQHQLIRINRSSRIPVT